MVKTQMCRIRRLSLSQRSWEKNGPSAADDGVLSNLPDWVTRCLKCVALWVIVAVWVISANCTLVKLSSDPAHLIL